MDEVLRPVQSTKLVFLSAGEPSGDLHGANLIRALQHQLPFVSCLGFGGPRMQAQGCELLQDMTAHAVMWVGGVVTQIQQFRRYLRQAETVLKERRPGVVVLIDYPGFNWHVARIAKRLEIPVLYYGVPQLWAWAPWRIAKMRRLVDRALCQLPFEPDWFRARGIAAEYVGHPYFDELASRQLDDAFVRELSGCDRTQEGSHGSCSPDSPRPSSWSETQHIPPASHGGPLVTLLPGSRDQEVEALTPWMLKIVARLIELGVPCRYAFACFSAPQAKHVEHRIRQDALPVLVHHGKTPELIEAASCCIACSGSVSLELLHHRKPGVILYRVGAVGYVAQDVLRTSRYMTLPNLIAADDIHRTPWQALSEREQDNLLFPEYLSVCCPTEPVVRHLTRWLSDPRMYSRKVDELTKLAAKVDQPGASKRAAGIVASFLSLANR